MKRITVHVRKQCDAFTEVSRALVSNIAGISCSLRAGPANTDSNPRIIVCRPMCVLFSGSLSVYQNQLI